MLSHYLKISLRNLLKNKVFSFINLAGLSVGTCVALLIGLWLRDELTFDRQHANHRQLFQVMMTDRGDGDQLGTWASMPLPLVDVMRKSVPEIKYVAEADWGFEHGLMVGDKRIFEAGMQVHPDFLKAFEFPLLQGDRNAVLTDPTSIVLSQKTAQALFGDADPMGQTVRVDNFTDMKVTGVLEDLPRNSSFDFQYLLPFSHFEKMMPWVQQSRNSWKNQAFQIYLELQAGVSEAQVLPKIKNLIKENRQDATAEVTLHPLDKWRLWTKWENGKATGGFIEYVRLFAIVGVFVLLIACINFMNLSTARSQTRAKEVGIRKTVGSVRGQLVGQFLMESLTFSALAFGACLLLAEVAMPAFNSLTNKELNVPYDEPNFWLAALGFIFLTGIMAGSYPAFFLSSFKPIGVLKGGSFSPFRGTGGGGGGDLPRKVLVVVQFTLSTALVIGTLVVFQQIQHAKNRPAGYDPYRLIMVKLTGDLLDNYSPLRNELLASGLVSGVTKASSPVTSIYANMNDVVWEGKKPDDVASFATVATSEDYFKTLGIKVLEGRPFAPAEHPGDSMAVIFNSAAIERMGLKNPVGKTIQWSGAPLTIVGVTDNVVMSSPYDPPKPTMFLFNPNWNDMLMFRLSPSVNAHEALGSLERIFQKHNPAYPFDYQFTDEQYSKKFGREELMGKLAGGFAGLAIFVSCLGLFGLATFVAQRRTKEIGIRKVLGASVLDLWGMLSKDFVALAAISCLVSAPLAAYFLQKWLDGFEYRVSLSWWVFGAAGLATVAVTLLTVSFQSVKAALANPVKSLRSE